MAVIPAGRILRSVHFGTPAQVYTPVLYSSGTNPDLGSGGNFTQEGWWWRDVGTVHVAVRLRFGTSGVSNGTGNYRVSLPVGIQPSTIYTPEGALAIGSTLGSALIRDNSNVGASKACNVQFETRDAAGTGGPSGAPAVLLLQGDGQQLQATTPWTWAASDAISFEVSYLVDDT